MPDETAPGDAPGMSGAADMDAGARGQRRAALLSRAGWSAARAEALAGDASARRYERLHHPESGATAVLMDAPVQAGEDVRPFARIARHLHGLGLSAPQVLAEDAPGGYLLLEDLGDALFARLLEAHPVQERALYTAATDLLVALHRAPLPPGIAEYDPPLMGELAALALDWYAPDPVPHAEREAFVRQIAQLCAEHTARRDVLILRDYHAENLIWLPGRAGVARVGLLDFQDAMAGHPAYDLVSLLQDARRDVAAGTEAEMLAHYAAVTGIDRAGFATAYAVLGMQRNLRILGVFARLCLRDGKPRYLDYLPRVWAYLRRDLAHPALAPLRARIDALLPAPDPALLQELRRRCPTAPKP